MGREREGKEGYRIAYIKRCLHPRIDECFSKVEEQSVGSPTGVKKKIGFALRFGYAANRRRDIP